jgi:hypothetical protein
MSSRRAACIPLTITAFEQDESLSGTRAFVVRAFPGASMV